ncbi:PAS domain S-box protein [Leptolyngbya sp. PCC 6406]|uniref:PAS domain S-box protein n=1 Tax=Leptolyngbya sp. PCC 6406 TaxID=1173264 RepID=UPI0002AC9666|nr:PAS domain S-box protein [Leptolyngbya sp. PCC 6406]
MSSVHRPAAVPLAPPDPVERATDDLFRAYVEAASDIVYTLDINGNFTFVNSYGLRLVGATETEIIGEPYLKIVAPEYHEPTLAAFANLLQTGELRDYEFVVLTSTEERIFVEVNGRLLLQNGELVGALGIGRDVTERKRFEAQLKMFSKALDSAHDSAVMADLRGQLLYANLATERIFGHALAAVERSSVDIFFPASGQARWLLDHAVGEGWSGQVVCQRQDGRSFPALVSVSPVCGEDGSPTAISIIFRDITQLEQFKAELASKNLELERANRLKSEFLANMSHELRTPMTSILGFSSLLEQQVYGDLNERQHLYVNQIHQSGEHLLTLINEVLDLSKIEAGQMNLHLAPIAVDALCQDALTMVGSQAAAKQLMIHRAVQTGLAPLVADELRVRQMLLNLLSNAIKFSQERGEVGLEARRDGDRILLTVWDQGVGIPLEKQNLLFQPFQQLDSSLARQYEGTGLGLALTQRLARLHGGNVTLESAAGEGARFTINLPLDCREESLMGSDTVAQAVYPRAAEMVAQGGLPPLPGQSSGQVLLVEDHPVNAMLLEHMLTYWGYETIHVSNGQAALDWLGDHRPTLVLMDVHLPGMDGLEVTRQIRSNPNWESIPIVATTALARRRDRERCLEAGMQEYLSKPINSAELVSVLAKYTWGDDD